MVWLRFDNTNFRHESGHRESQNIYNMARLISILGINFLHLLKSFKEKKVSELYIMC